MFQSGGTGDEFLDEFLQNEENGDSDLKMLDSQLDNMETPDGNSEGNASSLLDFFNQLNGSKQQQYSEERIKNEPLSEDDYKSIEKERMKKDNHNQSK